MDCGSGNMALPNQREHAVPVVLPQRVRSWLDLDGGSSSLEVPGDITSAGKVLARCGW